MKPLTSSSNTLILSITKSLMPKVGLGTWKIPREVCASVVLEAIQQGYRLFDCACDYGNEEQVGLGIQQAIKQGIVTRSDLFITSKLWCTFMEPQHVNEACTRSLQDLGLEYLDLYLIHFPISLKYVNPTVRYPPGWAYDPSKSSELVYSKATIQQTWTAMESLVQQRLVKNIGVANFNCGLLMDLLKYATIPPAVNQIELHPYLYQDGLVSFCQRNHIQITAFHSFGGQSLIELGNKTAIETLPLLQHQVVQAIAKKHGKTTAQVLLRWALERNCSVIPKSVNPKRLSENLSTLKFSLDDSDMKQLASMNQNLHFNDPKDFVNTPIWA